MKQTGNPEGLYIVELRVREGDLVGYMAEYCIGGDWYSALFPVTPTRLECGDPALPFFRRCAQQVEQFVDGCRW